MTFLYETLGVPFGFLLKLIYQIVGFHNYAISIILLTLFSRLIMTPSTISQQKGMAKTQRLQPKIRRIQAKFARILFVKIADFLTEINPQPAESLRSRGL